MRSFGGGSGRYLALSYPSTVFVLGEFGEGHELMAEAGGDITSVWRDGPSFDADSALSFQVTSYDQFVVLRNGDLWRGGDRGRYWERFDPPDSIGAPTAWIRLDDPRRILVGTREGDLMYAPRWGGGWTRIASFAGSPVRSVVPDGQGHVLVLLADGRLGIERADFATAPFRVQCIDMSRTPYGFALEADSLRIWRTIDAGGTWKRLSPSLRDPRLRAIALRARGLALSLSGSGALACGDALLQTDDAGRTWRIGASGPNLFLDVVIDAEENLLSVGDQIHRSRDAGASIEVLRGADFSSVMMGDSEVFWAQDRGLLRSTKHGDLWTRLALPIDSVPIRRIAASGDSALWLHFEDASTVATYRSTDQGATFQAIDASGSLAGLQDWDFPRPGIGWAATPTGVYRSETDGTVWAKKLPGQGSVAAFAALDSAAAAVVMGGVVWSTRDAGESWIRTDIPSSAAAGAEDIGIAAPDRCVIAGNGLITAGLGAGAPPATTYRSEIHFHSVAFADERIGWAVDDEGGIHGTTDDGATWTPYDADLQLSAICVPLLSIDCIDADHAVTGAEGVLIRLQPDFTAPILRIALTHNRYLPRFLDVDVSAKERLLDDHLIMLIDDVEIPVSQFDREGFLFRARFEAPESTETAILRVHGKDLAGNERFEQRTIAFVSVAEDGRAALNADGPWIVGRRGQLVTLLEEPDGVNDGTRVWIAGASEAFGLEHGDSILLQRGGGEWSLVEGSGVLGLRSGDRIALRSLSPPHRDRREADVLDVRIYPQPATDRIRLVFPGGMTRPSYRLLDISGRKLRGGVLDPGNENITIPMRDDRGRALPSGIYWLRLDSDAREITRRIVVLHP